METETAEEMRHIEVSVDAHLRCYLLILMRKLAPPEGVTLTEEDLGTLVGGAHHLLVTAQGGDITMRLVTSEERALILAPAEGNA